ncbi:MAG: DUF2255 family protein [Trebonia sp.]
MTTWDHEDLEALAAAAEIDIAVPNSDGTVGRATTIWIVRVGDDIYVRSYRGPNGSWYGSARRAGHGTVRTDRLERAVTFDADHDTKPTVIDAAYRAKYGRSSYIDAMVTPGAAATTLRLLPL